MARKKINNDWPIVAICYDFDKTLSPRDMQEYALIPSLGIDDPKKFWEESGKYAKDNGMDKMLSYMKLILDKAATKDVYMEFNKMGQSVELFDGVETWFDRINNFGKENEVNIEHYIISAGLKEIIDETRIAHHFKAIYASSFVYDAYEKPIWPRQVVNYTTKTQYLFRINKNCLDLSDEVSVNKYLEESKRRIPFRNFIYIGDSDTDIPAMRVVRREHGHSIGVYNPKEKGVEKIEENIKKVSDLIKQGRIDFFAPANYSEGSCIENIVKLIIRQIKANHNYFILNDQLQNINLQQKEILKETKSFTGFTELIDAIATAENINYEEINALIEELTKYRKDEFNKLYKNSYYDIKTFLKIINSYGKKLQRKLLDYEKINGTKNNIIEEEASE